MFFLHYENFFLNVIKLSAELTSQAYWMQNICLRYLSMKFFKIYNSISEN